ncbi:L-lactate dehydrogenase complex protein LldG [Actinoplanes lutulentus]|uniref:L-lactate dehydrogenase complex protein LldG n=1 Tax=Actinoplanes lutulentus TaxID=1287878 RepID=A0A327Z9U1_9ACTN|nr:LUD domain-containing protein [Actinoplanes lutulentus]MBB2946810.1 L-lactate dehydrogenase complex protein LldG [Actinoplanes lutulentus]RAK35702.1 L-lactate dehydrogenase complex protein LldG [Actinoplanes lutulentus]
MSASRELILSRVRAALRDALVVPEVPRDYRPAGRPVDLDVLVDRLVDYKATVHRIREDEIASTVEGLVSGAVLVPSGLPQEWRPAGALVDDGLAPDRIAAAAAVLTAAAVAVAETGTIVLDASPDQGRRIITLLPDVHIIVLRPEQVVAAVPDAVARLDARRPLTWISGPSATSDIELNRVEGVHGPRNLHVLLLG